MGTVSLKGVIDMHVHSNPDIRHRAYDDFELTEAAVRVGARAIVIKTHQGTTVDRAYLCNRYNERVHGGDNDFTMFGGVTMNRQVGGINPAAVESGLKLGAKVIWLPTQSARNHLVKNKADTTNCVDVVKDGKVVPELNSPCIAGRMLPGSRSGPGRRGKKDCGNSSGMVAGRYESGRSGKDCQGL